ncbi:hypothetical protein ACP4OV_027424 [Aristida adscensionis]
MELGGKGDNFHEDQSEGSGHVTWNSAASSFMVSFLANLVTNGTRTSSTFKKIHLNMCGKAINEHLKTKYTGDKVKNHLRTWQRKLGKINRLRKTSGAGWDEENCTITLDPEHYANHIAVHKADADFFNKPLEHYADLTTIFGSSMATGKFAKTSSDVLGAEEIDVDAETEEAAPATPATPDDHAATSSASKPNKKAKIAENEDEGLIGAIKSTGNRLAIAIENATKSDMDLPEDLFGMLNGLPGFNEAHIAFYYAYLVANPHVGRAFYKLPVNHKLIWVANFVAEKFPGN